MRDEFAFETDRIRCGCMVYVICPNVVKPVVAHCLL